MDIRRFDVADKGCRALVYQNTAYLSGIAALDFDADFEEQIKQVFARIDQYLATVGSSRSRLLNVVVFLKFRDHYGVMNKVWVEWLSDHDKPTRTTVIAELGHPDLLVEMSVIAALDSREVD